MPSSGIDFHAMDEERELRIGKVVKSHGIRGEVVVDLSTDEPDLRFAPGTTVNGVQGQKQVSLEVEKTRPHQGRLLVNFAGIHDRTTADTLRGMNFYAPPLESSTDEEGFYDHELEGLRVKLEGQDIGVVSGVSHGPAGEILEVSLDSEKQVLIPFVHAIVPEVDVEQGFLLITPPEGLLDL